jgi:hypothetical protein
MHGLKTGFINLTVEMHRVRPAVEAGLMQPAEAAALKMKPVLE